MMQTIFHRREQILLNSVSEKCRKIQMRFGVIWVKIMIILLFNFIVSVRIWWSNAIFTWHVRLSNYLLFLFVLFKVFWGNAGMQWLGEENQWMRNLELCRGLFCPTGRITGCLLWTRTSRSDFIAFSVLNLQQVLISLRFETFPPYIPYTAPHDKSFLNLILKGITDLGYIFFEAGVSSLLIIPSDKIMHPF